MSCLVLSCFFLALIATTLNAQQSANPAASETVKIPVHGLPVDPEMLANRISESFYHPDELAGVDCTASIDWVEMFKTLKIEAPSDRLKSLQSMTVQVHAVRDKPADFHFVWSEDRPTNHDQLEDGAKQMISGFYQMYWSFSSPSLIPKPGEINHIESQPTGETIITYSDHGINGSVIIDKNFVPEHFTFDSASLKGSLDPTFSTSPNPVPGDMRRLRSVHVVYQLGTSNLNADISMEYQTVGGFNIPSEARVIIPGAYSVPINFTACSVSKELSVAPSSKPETEHQ